MGGGRVGSPAATTANAISPDKSTNHGHDTATEGGTASVTRLVSVAERRAWQLALEHLAAAGYPGVAPVDVAAALRRFRRWTCRPSTVHYGEVGR